ELSRQADVVAAQTRPRISAFVRGGVGRPGLDILSTTTRTYWIGGVELQWNPFDWGRTSRERQALELERDAVTVDAAAFRYPPRRRVRAARPRGLQEGRRARRLRQLRGDRDGRLGGGGRHAALVHAGRGTAGRSAHHARRDRHDRSRAGSRTARSTADGDSGP